MSLLSIIQDTCDRIGVPRPTAVVSSTDQQVRQLYALANEEGVSLAKRADWQSLVTEWTFITVAQAEQTNTPIPTDLKSFVSDSFFNRTSQRPLVGPVTPQAWQAQQARPVMSGIFLAFRERQGTFLVTPAPTAGDTIAYEYVSASWAMSSAGQGKPAFTSDDDSAFLDEELIKQGLRWRWKQAKGLPYAEDMETYERAVEDATGKDGGTRALAIGGNANYWPDWRANIPEGSFGV